MPHRIIRQRLLAAGYRIARKHGSHTIYSHTDRPTVSLPSGVVHRHLAMRILREAGVG